MSKKNKNKAAEVTEVAKDELAALLELDAVEQQDEQEVQDTFEEVEEETEEAVQESVAPKAKAEPKQKTTGKMQSSFKRLKREDYTTKDGIHANPTFVKFPTDRWGLTKDLKAALIAVASRMVGAEDKKALVDEVLRVGVGHIEAKYALDNQKRMAQFAAAQAEAERRKAK